MHDLLKVGVGASAGSLARFALSSVAFTPLLLINVVGCYAMGRLRPGLFWGTGFLGGFTSFSAFGLLLIDGQTSPVQALLYATGHCVLCIVAWIIGDMGASEKTRSSQG